eukprot:scaffold375_cov189-Skeletonema_marinoi.AAC.10
MMVLEREAAAGVGVVVDTYCNGFGRLLWVLAGGGLAAAFDEVGRKKYKYVGSIQAYGTKV